MANASSVDNASFQYLHTRRNWTWVYNFGKKRYDFYSDLPGSSFMLLTTPFSKSRSWKRTDNFRVLKAAGVKLPDNPYSYDEVKNSLTSVEIRGPYSFGGGYRYQTRYLYPSFSVTVPVDPIDRVDVNRVYAKLISRAKGSSVSTPVFLAESRQTASMVVNRATTLVYGLRALRRGNVDGFLDHMHRSFTPSRKQVKSWKGHLRHAKRSTDGISAIWLEARYGWLPFVSEVYAAGEMLNQLYEQKEKLYSRVTARSELKWQSSGIASVISVGADGGLKMSYSDSFKEEVKVTWLYLPTEWDGLGRLGLTNPAEVVWELVPFSFVADWFLPIGNYLSYLDLDTRFKHVGGTVGRRKEVTRIWTNPSQVSTLEGASISGAHRLTSSAVSVKRSPLAGIPVPSLASISFSAGLNSKRVMDSISLLRQLTK